MELSRTDRDEPTALWQYQEKGGAIGYVGGTDPTALLPANAITHTADPWSQDYPQEQQVGNNMKAVPALGGTSASTGIRQ